MTTSTGPVQQFLASASAFALAPIGGTLLGALVTPKSQLACDCERGRSVGDVVCAFVRRVGDPAPQCENVFGFAFPGTGLTHPALFGMVAALIIGAVIWAIQTSMKPTT